MCAVYAGDGSRHHSASRARLHDDMSKGKAPTMEKPAAEAGETTGGTDVSAKPIADVVAEHGPAHHIVMHHDHKNGVHTVTSHHGEGGHMHHSEHSSAHEAHQHAHHAAGLDEEENTGEETPEQAEEEMVKEEKNAQQAGKRIPGLA